MPNSNYAQVPGLYAQGNLNWAGGAVVAGLFTGLVFNPAHQRLSELAVSPIARADINGRSLTSDGKALGLPATFQRLNVGAAYQVVVGLDDGRSDPLLLSFIEVDTNGDPISVARPGTLIVRPIEDAPEPPPGSSALPPTVGVWMTLPVPEVTPISKGLLDDVHR